MVGGEAAGPAGGAAGGKDVRRAGSVVTQSDWAEVAEKRGTGIVDFPRELRCILGRDVQMLWREQVRDAAGFLFIADQDQTAEVAEALNRQLGARKPGDLILQFSRSGLEHSLAPGDQDAGAGGMLRLGQQI